MRVPTRTEDRGGPNTGTPSMSFDTNLFVYPGRRAQENASGLRPGAHGTVSWNTVNGAAALYHRTRTTEDWLAEPNAIR